MRALSLRTKFNIGAAAALLAALMVLLGGRLLGKSANFHYLERQHMASVMQLKLATVQAAAGSDGRVAKQRALDAIATAITITDHADYELLDTEKVMFRLAGFGELIDLPLQVREHLRALDAMLRSAPDDVLTPSLAVRIEPEVDWIVDKSDRVGSLIAATVAMTKTQVLAFDVLGAFLFLSVLWALRRAVLPPLAHALRVADRIAQGDLTVAIERNRGDELGRLLAALARMQDSLAGMVSQLRASSGRLHATSVEIARRNEQLGGRTESQASALEETAASMEELGTTVQQNAASARAASAEAAEASSVARAGGEAVGQLVEKMKDMHASARDISEITTLIDAFAFQTNILALNAAVEAARAGAHGRGFGVVAEEVRALAGRSAEAAKAIRERVAASVTRAAEGADLADQARDAMSRMLAAIERVSRLVEEISAASAEQSRGTEQVGSAMVQIDGVTQQNAALVGELAAAARGLQAQARELVEAVGVFRIVLPSACEAARSVG